MILQHNFSKFVVFKDDSIQAALNKINANQSRLIFAVSEAGALEGVLTDGDVRRWLLAVSHIDLNVPVSSVYNTDFEVVHVNEPTSKIESMFSERILAVPLVDDNFRLTAVALPRQRSWQIGDRIISEESPAFIIAEIGNNHNGSLELAKRLIDEAVKAGADCAKFQMRDIDALYSNAGDPEDASADLGTQYVLDLLNRMQLSDEEMFEAFDYCRQCGIVPLCTPWDLQSLEKLERYGMPAYKVASADFTNYELIDAIAATGKLMICSTGMASEQEVRGGIDHLKGCGSPFVLLHCNSTYPAPFRDVNLKYMLKLKELSGGLVGYSGHERDINVAIGAVALGAKVLEKHFTLDKTMEGNDHKVSLLPDEFARMVEGVRQIELSLGTVGKRQLSQGEIMNRENLAKSLVAAVDIPAGTKVTAEMLTIRSPGQGLQPNRKRELIGKVMHSAKKAGDFFFTSDLRQTSVEGRHFRFRRSWGVPVRYHDLQQMQAMSNMDLLEIHLSYKDMDLNFRDYIPEPLDLDLVVHAPELFAGDLTLDLCTVDDSYRRRSIEQLQRVIDLTRELSPYFLRSQRPGIVTNVGGFSHDRHIPHERRGELYEILADSLTQLDADGIEILPQTMPPFPWHFGGQQFHNIFMDSESIVDFCKQQKMRICLDTSHSKLACNFLNRSFTEFVKLVGPFVAHLHIADARGVDGEGLQIGDGDMDWDGVLAEIDRCAPTATFIPEIWQGHKNNGEGAWQALECLAVHWSV